MFIHCKKCMKGEVVYKTPGEGDVGPMLGHLGAILGPSWAYVGPMLAQACPYLSLMLAHVAHMLADVGPMLAPRPARCLIFRSGPLPKTQNHEKPMVF